MRAKYESLALADLKDLAKYRGIKGTSTMKKAEIVEAMLEVDEKEKQEKVQNEEKPVEVYDIFTNSLPEKDAQRIKGGITVSAYELNNILSDYIS